MAKVKQPLLSFDARRKLGDDIVFTRRGGSTIAERHPQPQDAKSPGQLSWRHMFLKVVALWHALSAAEKEAWESLGRQRHMTGYAWFVSQALRPNPGIYLPLQGGTMSGDIDMAGNRILNLIAPTLLHEPLRRQDYVDYIQPYLLTEGAKVFHNASQNIPHATMTTLTFNSEAYDTDNIHSATVNPSRLTCKTAGKYLIIATLRVAGNAVGLREITIFHNGATVYATLTRQPTGAASCDTIISTIMYLPVNNFIECRCYQNSGGVLAMASIPPKVQYFMMQRIG